MYRKPTDPKKQGDKPDRTESLLEQAAAQKVYITPISATYTMRMQSNFFLNRAALPGSNECVFPFSYKGKAP